ncbi:MAG: ammonia-forming cytochrome c nitrite reductase [Opitutales bacterium]|nr:ammonia-forming cytochrome c nitrite reductase [Opitutales bacterium]
MKSIGELVERKPWVGWALFFITLLLVFIFGLFGASIIERRQEAFITQHVHPLPEWEPRNEVWGQQYPRQYDRYRQTARTDFASKHAGSTMIDYLEKYPEMVILWAGYAFSRDYNQGRGHYYSVHDVRETLRTDVPQPGTCWTCKSTDVPRLMNEMGVEEFYAASWEELGPEVVNHIGCQDCHDPKTMDLRITRPALVEAFDRQGKDIREVTHQEMRSLVCAQCHVEYYFAKDPKGYLVFPWDRGLGVEDMEEYFDAIDHVDWTHTLSRAPMIKAQHPDYELYLTGVHAERGVSCSDCHMPYRSEGGVKFTDHHLQSPLNNIANSCQVCHRESEASLREGVYARQDRIHQLRRITEPLLATTHIEAKKAWDAGASEEEMAPVLQLIRHAQWRWDFVAAANGMGIHSPLEAARILGTAIDKAGEARRLIARILHAHGVSEPVEMPDISTKAKAQAYIGLDMETLRDNKDEFLRTTVPKWIEEAEEREAAMQPAARVPRAGPGFGAAAYPQR